MTHITHDDALNVTFFGLCATAVGYAAFELDRRVMSAVLMGGSGLTMLFTWAAYLSRGVVRHLDGDDPEGKLKTLNSAQVIELYQRPVSPTKKWVAKHCKNTNFCSLVAYIKHDAVAIWNAVRKNTEKAEAIWPRVEAELLQLNGDFANRASDLKDLEVRAKDYMSFKFAIALWRHNRIDDDWLKTLLKKKFRPGESKLNDSAIRVLREAGLLDLTTLKQWLGATDTHPKQLSYAQTFALRQIFEKHEEEVDPLIKRMSLSFVLLVWCNEVVKDERLEKTIRSQFRPAKSVVNEEGFAALKKLELLDAQALKQMIASEPIGTMRLRDQTRLALGELFKRRDATVEDLTVALNHTVTSLRRGTETLAAEVVALYLNTHHPDLKSGEVRGLIRAPLEALEPMPKGIHTPTRLALSSDEPQKMYKRVLLEKVENKSAVGEILNR